MEIRSGLIEVASRADIALYDLIISAMAMHHVKDTAKLLTTFSKHLKPGGRIALADLDEEDGTFHEPGAEGG